MAVRIAVLTLALTLFPGGAALAQFPGSTVGLPADLGTVGTTRPFDGQGAGRRAVGTGRDATEALVQRPGFGGRVGGGGTSGSSTRGIGSVGAGQGVTDPRRLGIGAGTGTGAASAGIAGASTAQPRPRDEYLYPLYGR